MSKTVGFFCAGQAGDCLTISSVLRYREELWGDAKIVWYIDDANRDLLKHQDIELRTFPRGFGYPERCIEENKKQGEPLWENWAPLVDENNRLNLELKLNYKSLADIDEGYFPAPHQMSPQKRHGLTYPECSRKIFGCEGKEWHPVTVYSIEELVKIGEFLEPFRGRRLIFLETFAGSGQSSLDEEMVERVTHFCKKAWPECIFLMGSHKFLRGNEEFPKFLLNRNDVIFCKNFTVRECGLIASYCDIMVSVSSGITCAASAWGLTSPPMVQFTGSEICGTRLLANSPFEMVTADGKPLEQAKEEFYNKLNKILIQYK